MPVVGSKPVTTPMFKNVWSPTRVVMPTTIKLLPYIADPAVKDQWVDLYQEFVS